MQHAKISVKYFQSIFIFCLFLFVRLETLAFSFPVEVSESPSTDLDLSLKAIESAEKSLLINMYEFTSPEISRALVNRIEAGVRVNILLEKQVVGGFSEEATQVENQILDAMLNSNSLENHFYEMTSKAGGERRFRFNHAKYVVIDGKSLLIGSENFTPNSQPIREHLGSRGWEVWIHDLEIADSFKNLFNSDTDSSSGDIQELTNHSELNFWIADPSMKLEKKKIQKRVQKMQLRNHLTKKNEAHPPVNRFEAQSSTQVLSPDNSLDELSQLLIHARNKIDLELMTFDSGWGRTKNTSPLLNSLLRAARKGVKVRVLLNDETVFHRNQSVQKNNRNLTTVSLINQIAKKESLDMVGRIANLDEMNVAYIHNKGALVDGEQTLISSINWNQNSIENNREAAVILKSSDIYQHYESLFEKDWIASASFNSNGNSNFFYFDNLLELLNQSWIEWQLN